MKRSLLVLASLGLVGISQAQYAASWVKGDSATYLDNTAGIIKRADISFNSATNRLTWEATFGPTSYGIKPDSFFLTVTPGPAPAGKPGQLATFFFDGSKSNAPKLTVTNFNGSDEKTSYYDGSNAWGTQAPDRIKSSLLSMNWINSLTVRNNADGTRTMGFDIDATDINNHLPKYPGSAPWTGAAFANKVGFRMWTISHTDAEYRDGYLKDLDYKKKGWLKVYDEPTAVVPEPATMAALGLGVAAMIRRRRNVAK